MKSKRTVVRTAIVALAFSLGSGIALAAPSPPAGAVSCYGDWCSGQDPQSSGCSADGITVASAKLAWADTWLDLRWSPTCKTNWARVRGNGTSGFSTIKATQQPTGYTQGRSGGNLWSKMIYSPSMCVWAFAQHSTAGALQTACV